MAKRVIWSKPALADQLSILDYWHKRTGTKRYSSKLATDIKRIVRYIGQFPKIGRQLDGHEERFFVIDNYLLIYIEAPDRVEILHVWDSRRNPENLPL